MENKTQNKNISKKAGFLPFGPYRSQNKKSKGNDVRSWKSDIPISNLPVERNMSHIPRDKKESKKALKKQIAKTNPDVDARIETKEAKKGKKEAIARLAIDAGLE